MDHKCAHCCCEVVRKPSFWKRIKGLACCSKECRAEYLKIAYRGAHNPNWDGLSIQDRWWEDKVKRLSHTAKQRRICFELTAQQLSKLYEEQNGLCFYTGIPLKLASTQDWATKGQADPDVLSVDRVDSAKGYSIDNVVLCCTAINKMKGNSSTEDVQAIFNYIVAKHLEHCRIRVKLLPGGMMPMKSHLGDAGYDLFAREVEDQGNKIVVRTGVCVQPTPGWYMELVPRSSIVKKGCAMANSIGIIDGTYTGEIVAVFYKTVDWKPILVGERVAQLLPRRYVVAKFVVVDELIDTARGAGGFGSTGVK